jgi:uncharacterized coiled-coil protein SlyX
MADRASADIIPFPMSRLSAPHGSPAATVASEDRLSAALKALSLALAEQQEAVQRWRDALAELATSMRTLSGDLAKISAPAP